MSAAPLIITSPARCGSTLLARSLDAHPAIAVSCDPCLELFRSFRNACWRDAGLSAAPDLPFQDGFYRDDRLALLDAVRNGDLNTAFPGEERATLVARLEARAVHEAAEIVPRFSEMVGRTYRELFDEILTFTAEACPGESPRYAGIKEVWVIECLEALARAYPDARFLVLMRDPRAMVHSLVRLAEKNEGQAASVLSYLRHWRKYQAFLQVLSTSAEFSGRLQSVSYEELIRDPARVLAGICSFLGLEWDSRLLATAGYRGAGGIGTWRGNSSERKEVVGFSPERIDAWRTGLHPDLVALCDLVCGPELAFHDPIERAQIRRRDLSSIFEFEHAHRCSWSSDLADPIADRRAEETRWDLAFSDDACDDPLVVRRNFLFPEAYRRIRATGAYAR